jgi:hypothetical protein
VFDEELIRPDHPDFWDPGIFLPQTKIRPKVGGNIPFQLKSDQQILRAAVIRCYLERKWLVYVKPRQVGSSTFFTGVVYQHVAYRRGCKGAIIAHTKKQAEKLQAMAMRFWKTTPESLRVSRDTQKKNVLSFPDRDSELEIGSVQDDEPLRGDTAQIALCTEIGSKQWTQKQDAWSSILNAIPGPEDGGLLFAESTPFRFGDQLHQTVQEAEEPGSRWLSVFVPWTSVGEYASKEVPPKWKPRKDVLNYANEYKLTREQAHYLQTVLLPKCRQKWHKLRCEYPVTIVDAFGLAGEPLFDEEVLLRWLQAIDGGSGVMAELDEFISFKEPQPDHRYVITIDPASGFLKRDNFGLVVLDLTTCEVVAEFLGHRSAGQMAKLAARLGWKYNRAKIYVEANGVGEGVLSHLIEVELYPDIFCRKSADTMRDGGELVPGFWSGTNQKNSAISFLQDIIEDDSLTVYSVRLIRQLVNYRGGWDKRKRDEADGHFDLVAALAIAAWAYFHEVRAGRIRKRRTDRELSQANWKALVKKLDRVGSKRTNTPWGEHR